MTPSRVSSWVQHLCLAGADRKSLALSKLQLSPQLGVRESGHCVGATTWSRAVAACMLQSSVTCFWAPSLWPGFRLKPRWPSFQAVSSWWTPCEQAWPPELSGESSSQTGQTYKIPTPHWRTGFIVYQMCIGPFSFRFGLVWFGFARLLICFFLVTASSRLSICLSREIRFSQLSLSVSDGLFQ